MTKPSRSFFTDPVPCPYCGYRMDAATHAENEDVAPGPGDVGLCFKCAGVLVYDDRFALRAATEGELAEALRNPVVEKLRAAIIKRKRP